MKRTFSILTHFFLLVFLCFFNPIEGKAGAFVAISHFADAARLCRDFREDALEQNFVCQVETGRRLFRVFERYSVVKKKGCNDFFCTLFDFFVAIYFVDFSISSSFEIM